MDLFLNPHSCASPKMVRFENSPLVNRDLNRINRIWLINSKKPTPENLFSCLIEEVKTNRLIIENIRLDSQSINITIGFYGFIADSPAKSRCLSMTQYNGEYGCPYCNNPGLKVLNIF